MTDVVPPDEGGGSEPTGPTGHGEYSPSVAERLNVAHRAGGVITPGNDVAVVKPP